jgi:hypothetical protein
MAFGGVATGSMKAHEAASAAGIIRRRGWASMARAREAMMGRLIEAVAVLEVSSVSPATIATTEATRPAAGAPASASDLLPIQAERPETSKPLARARPPPKSRRMPQGTALVACQSIRRPPFSLLAGIRNSRSAMAIATVPSSIRAPMPDCSLKRDDQPRRVKVLPKAMLFRVIQSKATPAKTKETRFSSGVMGPRRSISSRMNAFPLKGLEAGRG